MADTVQQIKDRLAIQDVIGSYVRLTKAGANFKARCPFHSERTPSFTVSPSRGTYHCFGCGVGGDIFSFVQEIEGLDFKGALKVLAERAGVPLVYERVSKEDKDEREQLFAIMEAATKFFEKNLSKLPKAVEYLKGRGLTDATIQSFRIGFAPDDWRAAVSHLKAAGFSEQDIERSGLGKRTEKGMYDRFRSRIMFPIYDSAGRVIAFSGRIFAIDGAKPPEGQEPPKYVNSPETPLFHKSNILFGYDRAKLAIRKYDCTVFVEGQMDLVMAHQAGWTNAVAASGTAVTPEHVALVKRLSDNLILALDADEAGIRAAAKSARIALAAGMDVKVAALPEGKDPADLIKEEGVDAWNQVMRGAKHVITFLLDVLEARQKDPRAFARAVEKAVVPFIATIPSPIDREHFVREAADRINVPVETIREALSHVPKEEAVPHSVPNVPSAAAPRGNPRERQLIGLYLWQKALTRPHVDLFSLEEQILKVLERSEVVGEGMGSAEQESLRFSAEGLYGDSEHLAEDTKELLRAVQLEKLREHLSEATQDLRRAERAGDEAAVSAALERCQLYTGEIAKLDTLR